MRFERVCIESLGYGVPQEVVTSDAIEERLTPLYTRLRLPAGRLELMTGIRERRFWPAGTLPSQVSVHSGRLALRAAEFDVSRVGALVHGSVCRDHLEPATASAVHHHLGLPPDCLIYDLSNACLGLLNGILQVANMIELGQIQAGLVVGSEGSRQLVETTVTMLNERHDLSRASIKSSIASLTIGSASCAILLTDRQLSRTGTPLIAAAYRANTAYHDLCHSGQDEAVASGMQPLMDTDSEQLLHHGIETGRRTLDTFMSATGWTRADIDKTICHQVGSAHHKLLFDTMQLDMAKDFATYPWLGNTGSAALPITLAIGAERGHLQQNDRVGLFGIGSGINCVMLALHWGRCPVLGLEFPDESRLSR
ncbi:MAG: 3-oxoacyl-ACP synthase III [Pirellulaceae bacterium]|nr:3-oxoacyl-ACP synthase III [Planctomycetales bacterium]